ncbi:hypothetical protein M422DRAFT_271137 [Sphaerobolus stellatus SS14]|uniref:Uncharacterized protein n=1 Tax=Sphaerobolus stellatus (strain SS14) TaxID=990650 RepID=A0A0C9TED7_SPHS4|nr:hypothetical protein M422DRAFT_271137 [Sphaerobolus stellatus SS14]
MTSRIYHHCPSHGSGIRNFNRKLSFLKPTVPDDLPILPNADLPMLAASLSTLTPMPSSLLTSTTKLNCLSALPFDTIKTKGKGCAVPLIKGAQEGQPGAPFIVSDEEDDAPSTPTPKTSGKHTGSSCQVVSPPKASGAPTKHSCVAKSIMQATRHSHHHRPYPPSERFFGDTYGLHEPVDVALLSVHNIDVPLLTAEQSNFYKDQLRGSGIPNDVMFMLLDCCDCGKYFTKDYLHHVHGLSCIKWVHSMSRVRPVHPLYPAARNAVARILHHSRHNALDAVAATVMASPTLHQPAVAGTPITGPSTFSLPILFPLSPTSTPKALVPIPPILSHTTDTIATVPVMPSSSIIPPPVPMNSPASSAHDSSNVVAFNLTQEEMDDIESIHPFQCLIFYFLRHSVTPAHGH